MKKIIIVTTALLFSATSFSFSFTHHTKKQAVKSLQGPLTLNDFTGIWSGRCEKDQVSMTIKQGA